MTTSDVQEGIDEFPREISTAVDGMAGEAERAVLTLLFNEGGKAFTELQERIGDGDDLHQQTLTDALDSLKAGGLIRKRVADVDEELSAYYTMSTFGERFIDALFNSLGTVDGANTTRQPIEFDDVFDGDLIDSADRVAEDMDEKIPNNE